MASTVYMMKEGLGPCEFNIVVREVCVLASFVEIGVALDIATWNASRQSTPHKIPGDPLNMVFMRLK